MKLASNIIRYDDQNANMYGCQPCPKCHSLYRAAYKKPEETRRRIECDDCGFKETCNEEDSQL